jgi:hypothetical protein
VCTTLGWLHNTYVIIAETITVEQCMPSETSTVQVTCSERYKVVTPYEDIILMDDAYND